MKQLAVIAALLVAGAASAQGLGGPGLASGSFSARILASGATGTDLTLSGALTTLGDITITGGPTQGIFWSSTSASGTLTSNISSANAGATAGTSAFRLYPQSALDATDYVLSIGTAANAASLFNVAYNGATSTSSTLLASLGYQNASNQRILHYNIVSSSDTALYGNAADSAGAGAIVLTNATAMTSGQDRYVTQFSRGANGANVVGRVFTDGTYQNLATVGTAASGTGITATYSGAVRQWVHKVVVTNAAMAAAGTTDITLHTTPVNTSIKRVLAEVTQVFDDGAGPLTAVAVTCGNSAGGNQYLLSHSELAATGAFGDVVAEMGAGVVSATLADMGTVATGVPGAITVQCRFTCTGANCSVASTGSTTFIVEGVTY